MSRRVPRPPLDFRASGFAVLRTPFLPFTDLPAAGQPLRAPEASDDELEEALAADAATLRHRLRGLLERPEILDALFLASPDLAGNLQGWRSDPDAERGRKVERSLVKYLTRMASRSTPFGLFAGCSVVRLGDDTRLRLAPRAGYVRHTRLDMEYLSLLVAALNADPRMRRELSYTPNSSLYGVGEKLHCIETRMRGRHRVYDLVAVDGAPHVVETLRRAEAGATIAELAAGLTDDEVTPEEAAEFVEELVDAQLLVSELETCVTGPEPVHALIRTLGATHAGREAAEALERARAEMEALDRDGPGATAERYRGVAGLLAHLPAEPQLSRLFQVDLIRPAGDATLGATVVDEVARGIDWLRRIHLAHPDPLARFRDAFAERYERRAVPLVEVLDAEIGIGFSLEPAPPEPAAIAGRTAILTDLLLASSQRGGGDLVLSEADLARLATGRPAPLPDAFFVTATVGAASAEALRAGEFVVALGGVSGPSGATLFGRFCHADPELHERVGAHLRAEEALRPDAVFAEVVHLPMGRLGNVICRPVLREYEIPFLGRSGAPPARQLRVTDLLVSVDEDRVVLTSRSLGQEVLPSLTSAHNYSAPTNLPLYQFLCALQVQQCARPGWDWGALWRLPHLPRVRFGRLVFSPARWNVGRTELEPLGAHGRDARFRAARRLRERLGLPRLVSLADGDNHLLVDFDDVLSVDAFASLVKTRPSAVLTEMVPGPSELCVEGPEGHFTHELVLPFERVAPRPTTPAARLRPSEAAASERSYAPGSEWLYVKLYAGRGVVEQVLREAVEPVVREAVASGAADRWFFLRYADPEYHLRVRFHGDPDQLLRRVLPMLREATAAAVAERRIWRIQVDTYEQEVERYGGLDGVRLAERIFHADSEAALDLLANFPGDNGAEPRRLLALRGIDDLLGDFGLGALEKRDLLAGSARPAEPALRRQWSDAYRRDRAAVEHLLRLDGSEDDPLALGVRILARRSERVAPLVGELREAEGSGTLERPTRELALSFTHMFANRLVRDDPVLHERIHYEYLRRFHESCIARARPPRAGRAATH